MAYVEGISGPHGIYLMPLIHPSVQNVNLLMQSMAYQLVPVLGRPVYFVIRSFQGWLTNHVLEINAKPLPRQALLVKYLAVNQINEFENAHRSLISVNAKPAAPIIQHIFRPKSN